MYEEEMDKTIIEQERIIEEDNTDGDYVSYDINSYPAFYTLKYLVFDESKRFFV